VYYDPADPSLSVAKKSDITFFGSVLYFVHFLSVFLLAFTGGAFVLAAVSGRGFAARFLFEGQTNNG
jgi:hypothetical protein